MNRSIRVAAAIVLAALPVALAAPSFKFSSEPNMNMMSMGEVTDITAYPSLKLVYRAVNGPKATLVYTGTDAAAVYAFYDKALKSEGWKDAPMGGAMTGGAMMGADKGTMATGSDTMGSGDAMASGSTMATGVEGMKMKDGSYQGRYAKGTSSLGLSVRVMAGKVHADLSVR